MGQDIKLGRIVYGIFVPWLILYDPLSGSYSPVAAIQVSLTPSESHGKTEE